MFSCVTMKVEFSTSWFSLYKLHYKKEINDTNSRHIEAIELWNKKKQQMEGKSGVTVH